MEHYRCGKSRKSALLYPVSLFSLENAEKARHVECAPYGGSQGMLLRAQPFFDSFDAIEKKNPRDSPRSCWKAV